MTEPELITKTLNLLEDLARKGVIRVSINRPPRERATSTLFGVFALVPVRKKSFSSDALWRTIDHHGGHTCGNGMGYTKDGQYYWCQSQANENFFTGDYTWVGQETNDYRKWHSPELDQILFDL